MNNFKIVNILSISLLLLVATIAHAQDEAKIKAISELACGCTDEIDGTLAKDKVIEAINSCIETTTLTYQLTAISADSDAAKKNGDTSKKEYNVTLDENFKEIQAYLNKNCATVQKLMSASVGQPLSESKKAMAFYEEGRAYTEEQKYDMAVVSYNKAVKADPKFTTAWDYMGINYRRLGNYTEAIKCYQKSLSINPKGALPLQNTAIAYEYLKDYNKAALAYENFMAVYPENPEGYYGAGRMFYELQNYEKGVDYMIKAYLKYTDAKSPYANDAKQSLGLYYKDLKEKNKLDIFMQAAKNNNLDLK